MYIDMFGKKRYKIGLHIHTTRSDGRATPEQCAKLYKEAGFDAIAFTDHWAYSGDGEVEGLKIISGCEYNVGGNDTSEGVMHIVGFGMTKNPEIQITASRQEIIDGIKKVGGVAVLAHPAWSLNTVEDALSLEGFGAVEIYNTVSGINQSFRAYSGMFVDELANKGVVYPITATDDVHFYEGEDETKSYIMAECDELTTESICDAVVNGRFYATQAPELHIKLDNGVLSVNCSPCNVIRIISNAAYCGDRVVKGEKLTEYNYNVKDFEKWLRVEVDDEDGKTAWSNIILVK